MNWAITLLATAQLAFAQGGPSVEGNWLGTLDPGPAKLRVALKISRNAEGALVGTLDSFDQRAMDRPLSGLRQEGMSVKFTLQQANAAYEGTLSADGAEIAGRWKQNGGDLPLVFHRTAELPTVSRPQEPKKPYPYSEEEVAYDNEAGGAHLTGALTLPPGAGPFPAALLITGSGLQDRDESIMGHKPFLVLADHLTRQGIAVLRVDDRTMGGSTGDVVNATTADFAGDVEAGIEFLKTHKKIDPRKIGLIGHSEGGAIAPMVAARNHDVAFVVMLAGTGVRGEEVILAQSAALAKSQGASEAAIAKSQATERQVLAIVKEEPDQQKREERLSKIAADITAGNPAAASAMASQFKAAASPWFRYFVTYDPAPALEKLACPVLALNGELDVQVDASQNLPAIVKALEAGGNKDYEIVKFPKLNHLLQTAKTGMPAEYPNIEETMAPVALETISAWILRHTR